MAKQATTEVKKPEGSPLHTWEEGIQKISKGRGIEWE
jgi:hypothetical protein